ncbi:RNA polymerase ii-associated protein 2 [Plakobranchus ocellatus]|uniref:protein-serine/threonine phosphatase n=1 Tax=Plakobranchus ocellatus TaxID=259542 RepID=A0AAV4CXE4_9GAST|nr:RNA polymerase ii-associated protein 2 [Plakobranchus ocellatus]
MFQSFCSNQCFRASRHFSAQIPESPLWMRDKETLHEISLLQHNKIKGIVGDEVIGSNPRKVLKDDLESLEELDKKTLTSKRRPGVSDAERNGRQTKKEPANNREDGQESSKPISKEIKLVDGGHLLSPDNDESTTREISDRASSVSADFSPAGAEITETQREKTVMDGPDLPSLVQKLEHLETDDIVSQEDSNSPKSSGSSFADSSHGIVVPNHPPQAASSNNSSQTQDKTLAKMDLLKTLLSKRKNVLSKMADVQTLEQLCPDDSSTQAKGCEPVKKETEVPLVSGGSDGNSKSDLKSSSLSNAGHSVTASPSPQTQEKSQGIPSHSSPCSPLLRVCEILKTWVTRESGLYLSSHSDSEGIQRFSDPEVQQRYGALCHRLAAQEQEMEAELDSSLAGEKNARASKPVPDYKALKEQTEAFKLNVMEFITGKKQVLNQEDNQAQDDSTISLPTVDSYNQHQIRVKIVLDRLDKSLPDVLTPLQLSVQDVSGPVREFIYTCTSGPQPPGDYDNSN